MLNLATDPSSPLWRDAASIDVSIVMPCLNEAQSLPHCIANARVALARIAADYALGGEIVIADNGSHDGSRDLAASLGARVVAVAARGYGAAIIGGCGAAFGRYLLIGDADGSYDFTDGVAMIGRLAAGDDLCMGSRFRGGIAAGAMPWKNRHIGNPALTGILNLFFRSGIGDAHCGLRAISKAAFVELDLSGQGMEFASEMVVKASLRRMRIAEVPARLGPDLRHRAPHLRPWRDGWRHLRYLIMLSPTFAFGIPGIAAISAGAAILAVALLHAAHLLGGMGPFGASWAIVAGFLVTSGHVALLMGVATHLHGVRTGDRPLHPLLARGGRMMTLETMLLAGAGLMLTALVLLVLIAGRWSAGGYAAPASVLPLVIAAMLGACGLQTIFGAFVLAIVGGHSARFAGPAPCRRA